MFSSPLAAAYRGNMPVPGGVGPRVACTKSQSDPPDTGRTCRTPDGEPLESITVHFQLVSNSNLPAIRAALDDLPPLRKESDAFWNWVEEKALQRKFAKGQAANTQPSARRWTTAPSCLAPSNSRRMRSRCRSTRKPGRLAGGGCWNRFSRGSCALPLSSGRPSNR
jgi:hypothetical protein